MMAACGQKKTQQVALGDSASRDIKLTVPDSTVPLNDAPSSPTANKVDTVYLPQATPPKVVSPKPKQTTPTYQPMPSTPPSTPPMRANPCRRRRRRWPRSYSA